MAKHVDAVLVQTLILRQPHFFELQAVPDVGPAQTC